MLTSGRFGACCFFESTDAGLNGLDPHVRSGREDSVVCCRPALAHRLLAEDPRMPTSLTGFTAHSILTRDIVVNSSLSKSLGQYTQTVSIEVAAPLTKKSLSRSILHELAQCLLEKGNSSENIFMSLAERNAP